MSDENNPYDGMPSGKVAQLRYSISNLWDDFGHTDSVSLGVVINLGMVLLGVLVAFATDGWLSYLGAFWALFNSYPFVQWVLNL